MIEEEHEATQAEKHCKKAALAVLQGKLVPEQTVAPKSGTTKA